MSNVSRAVYQKLAEENKRLLKDIYILTAKEYSISGEKILLVQQYRDKYEKDRQFHATMKKFAEKYFKEHPELDIRNKLTPSAQSSNDGTQPK